LRRGLLAVSTVIWLLVWAWIAGSFYHFEFLPKPVGLLGIGLWLAVPAWAVGRFGWRRAAMGAAAFGLTWAAVFVWVQRPRLDRDWTADNRRVVQVRFSDNGRHVEIQNVRNFRFATPEKFTEDWQTRRYDLATVRSVDFVLEPLPSVHGMAHTLLSFGFADGRHLAVSVEIRKEVGEEFHPVTGLFRRYELIYVVADERDQLGLRLNARGHDLKLYPIDADPKTVRKVLTAMLKRAEKLGRVPEFYHTLRSTCTTNLVRHLDELDDEPLGWQWRVLLPLYADELAWELGLIGGAGSLEEARSRYRAHGPIPADVDERTFSKRLRAGR
ncbi:MAG: DUF4105 domain-containing protein, partial [Phycisphaeraceae bacterium]|nr:DUF4105 domain-containing protein [Phycisphaeraceae bacterium]